MGRKKSADAAYRRIIEIASADLTTNEIAERLNLSHGYVRVAISRYALPFKRKGRTAEAELRVIVHQNIRRAASSVKTIAMIADEVGEDIDYVEAVVYRYKLPYLHRSKLAAEYAKLYYRVMGTAPDSELP